MRLVLLHEPHGPRQSRDYLCSGSQIYFLGKDTKYPMHPSLLHTVDFRVHVEINGKNNCPTFSRLSFNNSGCRAGLWDIGLLARNTTLAVAEGIHDLSIRAASR